MNSWIVDTVQTICHDSGMPLPLNRREKGMGVSSWYLIGAMNPEAILRPGIIRDLGILVLISVEDFCNDNPKIRLEYTGLRQWAT